MYPSSPTRTVPSRQCPMWRPRPRPGVRSWPPPSACGYRGGGLALLLLLLLLPLPLPLPLPLLPLPPPPPPPPPPPLLLLLLLLLLPPPPPPLLFWTPLTLFCPSALP